MTRAVVNVATTDFYQRGQARLREALHNLEGADDDFDMHLWDGEPPLCPLHRDVPYAMKAYALRLAADEGDVLLLWCDSCIVPVRSMEPLWKRIEKDGYWFAANGFTNAQWCADSWYGECMPGVPLEEARALNRGVPHVVATCFGLNVKSAIGLSILNEYYRLASETRAFCGPWRNTPETPCGPAEVLGHRHDQSCLSWIAHRHGVKLTNPPEIFSYPPGDESTIVLADGAYT